MNLKSLKAMEGLGWYSKKLGVIEAFWADMWQMKNHCKKLPWQQYKENVGVVNGTTPRPEPLTVERIRYSKRQFLEQ